MKPKNQFLIGLGLLLLIQPNLWSQPVPHHFSSITVLPDQTVTLSLDGSVSNMFNLSGTISNQFMQLFDLYAVEASTNLMDWDVVGVRTAQADGSIEFEDARADSHRCRFYRIVSP